MQIRVVCNNQTVWTTNHAYEVRFTRLVVGSDVHNSSHCGRFSKYPRYLGDDIGQPNISNNTRGLMGYETPNIERILDLARCADLHS